MSTRREADLVLAKIYEGSIERQLRDRPLLELDRYPGFFERWAYSKTVLPVALDGLIDPGGLWRRGWLTGWNNWWDSFSGVDLVGSGFGPNLDDIVEDLADIGANIQDLILRGNSIDAYVIVTDTSVDVVSDAVHVLTVPANHAYKVILASIRNNDRAPAGQLAFTPNGGTASILSGGGGAAGITIVMLGGQGTTGLTVSSYMVGPLWMQTGDTLEIADLNFVATDVMRKEFIFEDYTVT